ncbi:MAG: restriction endonuclease subunit S [Clostridia bacterium]
MEYRLEELCKIGSSKRIYLSEYTESGIPFYRGKEIIEKSNGKKISSQLFISLEKYEEIKSKFNVPKIGDILISAVGTLGKSWFVDEENFYFKDGNLIWLYDFNNEIINNRFLYYKLKSKWFENIIDGISIGSTQKAITIEQLKKVELDIPDIKLQNKIVEILDGISIKIEVNNQTNDNLFELGDTLYKEYYFQYINNLPEGYEIKSLKEVAENFDSKRKPLSSRERKLHKGIYPYYGATSIIDHVDNYIFDDIYVLMGEDGTVKTSKGNPVLQYIWGKNWINNHAHVLKGTKISTEHLYFALRNVNVEPLITGAVQPKINQENMNKISFVIGTNEVNTKFENIIGNIMKKSKQLIEENKILEQLRDTLLPKLMNGEIDLDKIEI